MPIKTNTIIRSSDGSDYIYLGSQFRNLKTGRMAGYSVQAELEREAIKMGYVEGESIFTELLERSVTMGYVPERNRDSREWMQNAARGAMSTGRSGSTLRSEIMAERTIKRIGSGEVRIGRPIVFGYDAKGKKELPYYDQLPVVVPISKGVSEKGGNRYFIGLNFHYLDYVRRAKLLDALYSVRIGISREGNLVKSGQGIVPMMEESISTKIDITYGKLLEGVSKYKGFKPTLHKYLLSHVSGSVLEIPPVAWTMIFFLPIAKFSKGVSQQKVWKDSVDHIDKDG